MSHNSDLSRDREFERLVHQETLIADATELICELLHEKGITRQDLARRLGKSKGFVTQILSGERNMTLRTLADVAFALDRRLELASVDRSAPRTFGAGAATSGGRPEFVLLHKRAADVEHRFEGWGEGFAAPGVSGKIHRTEFMTLRDQNGTTSDGLPTEALEAPVLQLVS